MLNTTNATEENVQSGSGELHIDPFAKETVDKQAIWERKLLNLTMSNALLNVRPGGSYIQIITTDLVRLGKLLVKGTSLTINERRLQPERLISVLPSGTSGTLEKDLFAEDRPFRIEDKSIELLNQTKHRALSPGEIFYESVNSDLGDGKLRTYLKKDPLMDALKVVYRKAKLSVELGANTLFLTIGTLKWFDEEDKTKEYYAPLLLFPVELVRRSATSGYTLRGIEDGETMVNITLLQKLKQVYKMEIPWLNPLPLSGGMVDIRRVLDIMRDCIKEYDGWTVEETAFLGNFDYDTFMMWSDIHNNADVFHENPVVGSFLNGVVDRSVNEDVQSSDDLDAAVTPGEIMLPISADSSQLEAIKAALDGKSFILHGPPGTGKSQTITNIIANTLYRGKRVLFVAEKKAALDVVYKRLEEIGISPFCLMLDTMPVKKSSVMERFKLAVNALRSDSNKQFIAEAERVRRLRDEIKTYMDSLHEKYPLGLSLYDCLSLYCACPKENLQNEADVTSREFVPSAEWLLSLRPEDRTRLEDVVSQYITACSICDISSNSFFHPLCGIIAVNGSVAEIARALESIDASKTLSDFNRSLKTLLGETEDRFSRYQTEAFIELAKTLMGAQCLTAELLSLGEDDFRGLEKTIECARKRDIISKEILGTYSRRVLDLAPDKLRLEYDGALAKGAIGRFLSLRTMSKKLGIYSTGAKRISVERISRDIEMLENYAALTTELKCADLSKIFGKESADEITDGDYLYAGIAAARAINKSLISIYGRDKETILLRRKKICAAIQDGLTTFREYEGHCLKDFIESFDALMDGIYGLKSVIAVKLPDDEVSGWVSSLAGNVQSWKKNLDKLRDWNAYLKARSVLEKEGLGNLVEAVENDEIRAEYALVALRKGIYRAYAEYIISCDSSLSEFHGIMFEEKIRRFRDLCGKFETLTREEIINKLAISLPDFHKEASESRSISVLLKNISNHCRGISLRTLFDLIRDILPRIFPCMMMSPLTVAEMLKADAAKFDLVIFDEASQIPTCEAVGAIARGKAVVVAGDPNQMPPTRFFQADTFDEDNAIIEDLESILDDSLALSLPSICLKWHYRSRHESLIAFSNSMYYKNELMTFPSPDDLKTKVLYEYVPDGVYEKGGRRQNLMEARAVVKEIENRLSDPQKKSKSIGVITFNIKQQSLIEDLLDELYRSNPALEKVAEECDEPIFVKNLENVQGDERDVILFSVGYGPDKNGDVSLNFGPLNRAGGWRRLNVAVSRARCEMKVFSTLRSDQITVAETSAGGVVGLKRFLEYAEKGMDAIKESTIRKDATVDNVISEIAERISDKWGFKVDTNIGCSDYRIDIGIVEPGADASRYILGIICDGYNSQTVRTVRDREVVQPSVLESLGWNICRVWTMDWVNNQEKVLNDIASVLTKLGVEIICR